jgi:hypothetical protein
MTQVMRTIAERWRNYWFGEGSYFDLALLRIGATGLQCYLLLSNGFGRLLSVNALPDEMFRAIPMLQVLMLPLGLDSRPDPDSMVILFWFVLAFGIASLLGILTNVSLALFAIGYMFLQSYIYSFGDMHHPEAIMAIALLALAFSPSGKVLSLDALVGDRVRSGARTVGLLHYAGTYAFWPIAFLRWFFPLMYLSAVVAKVSRSGLEWANGFTLQYALIQDGYRHDSELAIWLSQFHEFIKVTEWLVLLFQATFFLILFFPRLKWIYLPVGICFHLGIWFTMKAPFPQWLLFYAVYIPWSRVFRNLAAGPAPERTTAAA